MITAAQPQGYRPADLQSAYAIDVSRGAGVTIAIVDAQDDPQAEQDLATYRSSFGLPPCTSGNGCFTKVNQSGAAAPLPAADARWATEIMLDLDMASAACPSCKLLLVEANTPSYTLLGQGIDTAVALGASVVSLSWGAPEVALDFDLSSYGHPGTAIFGSAGDSGFEVEFPAASPSVIAVGGTSLTKSSGSRGWLETAWSGGGAGCSKYAPKPAWQTDSGCAMRAVNDVAAIADPNTGVAVYDAYGAAGWIILGGTSAATPLVAGVFAVSGHAAASAAMVYEATGAFYDVTTGHDGTCTPAYLCTAGVGYDGPTGVGTPNASALLAVGPPAAPISPWASTLLAVALAGVGAERTRRRRLSSPRLPSCRRPQAPLAVTPPVR
jgi:subtilase family serine protease